ncbi:hypothetical protein BCR32DRAFT_247612 [Anaeromyces robustus]|uniref:Uncharacterized protein n=1 Tax=Anaeromyces robustus TaxID=1754192 RepID=A0A1Y1WXK2_9FUNG|nr:hypothetical protein BCR32DRAFT_247612 [Anaeromyces robustus]|eukprot:ORX77854.1 hypothetical protein BCR32DRAFT_247612 [Anaeromyces robustus]
MKSKFLIVLLLGVINAIIIGIFIKSQNFSNTTSLLKNILNYSNKDNIKVKEAQFNNKEVPINKKDEIYKDKVIENESNISKQNQKPLVKENKNIETGKEEKFNDKETLKQINNKKENNVI